MPSSRSKQRHQYEDLQLRGTFQYVACSDKDRGKRRELEEHPGLGHVLYPLRGPECIHSAQRSRGPADEREPCCDGYGF